MYYTISLNILKLVLQYFYNNISITISLAITLCLTSKSMA